MAHKRSSKNFQMEREPKQTGPKGCCCKRSQCIKNYCDCYQSMVVCSIHCKCIGCRNTEERRSVDAPPIKTAVAAKRERAAALSAKAAAAAAKSGVNMHIRPTSSSATFVVPQGDAPPILQLPDMDVGNLVTMPPLTTIAQTKKPPIAVVPPMPKVKTPKDINVIKPAICVALLERVMLMASEAEEVGMNTVQVGKLVLKEFGRGLKDINECYTTINPE